MRSTIRQHFTELRRRGVFRTGGIYLGSSWLLLQVFDVALLPIGIPPWLFGVVVWLVILGFPLTLAFSWRYDITSKGIMRTPAAEAANKSDLAIGNADLAMLGLAGLLVTAMAFHLTGILKSQSSDVIDDPVVRTPAPANTIAVLPFKNMVNGDDDYFGQGLAEDILHRLTGIPGIQVASTTASFELDTSNLEMTAIGDHLAVRNVLEGSVRLDGDRVRIVAQLIDVENGYHLWSGRYDRRIEDVFRMYDDISLAVVTELQLTMAPETELIKPPPTVITEAYDYYLQARSILQRVSQAQDASNAQRFFSRAVELDPRFAEAWAGQCRAWLLWHHYAPESEKVAAAEDSCRRALELNPELAESHAALGELYHSNGLYERAIIEFNRALKIEPELAIAWRGLGSAYDEMGDEVSAENALFKAVELDPNDLANLNALGNFHYSRGHYAEAVRCYERAVNLPGATASAWNSLGAARLQMGEFEKATTAFRQVVNSRDPKPAAFSNIAIAYYMTGHFEDSVVMHEEAIKLQPENPAFWSNLGDSLREIEGREGETLSAYSQAVALSEELRAVNPRDIELLTNLAHCYARLDDDENAMRYINIVLRSMPTDTYSHYYASLIHLEAGRSEKALAAISHAVELNYPIAQLRRDPQFKSLHGNQKFKELISELDKYGVN